MVFGLPVFGLELFGRSLGGPESGRWVALLQGLLAGWVLYVGAAGMLLEGILWLRRRRLGGDLLVAGVAVAASLFTLARLATYALTPHAPSPRPANFPALWFHWAVLLLIVWTGVRWWSFSRGAAPPHQP